MDTLKDTLALVNDWLKFAEAKNAIVVTAAGVALWASVRLIVSNGTGFYVGKCLFRVQCPGGIPYADIEISSPLSRHEGRI